jgi:hypothetical protein
VTQPPPLQRALDPVGNFVARVLETRAALLDLGRAEPGTVADELNALGDVCWLDSIGLGLRIAFSREVSLHVDPSVSDEDTHTALRATTRSDPEAGPVATPGRVDHGGFRAP